MQQFYNQFTDRTLYVEYLPKDVTIAHIKHACLFLSAEHEIAHIELPVVPGSKKPRGFAFIEFNNHAGQQYFLQKWPWIQSSSGALKSDTMITDDQFQESDSAKDRAIIHELVESSLRATSRSHYLQLRQEYLVYQKQQSNIVQHVKDVARDSGKRIQVDGHDRHVMVKVKGFLPGCSSGVLKILLNQIATVAYADVEDGQKEVQ